MALNSSRTHLKAISLLGAGAALLVVFGYLLMKSDRKKPKRKSSKSSNLNTEEIDADMESSFNLAIQASKNKQKNLEFSKSIKTNQCTIKKVTQDDHVVPNIDTIKINNNNNNINIDNDKNNTKKTYLDLEKLESSVSNQIDKFDADKKLNEHELFDHQHETDKISETSSDSGQGQSEMLLGNNDFDASDLCLNSADNNSNCSVDETGKNGETNDYDDKPEKFEQSEMLQNQTVPVVTTTNTEQQLSNASFNSIDTNYSTKSSSNKKKSSKSQKSNDSIKKKETHHQSKPVKSDKKDNNNNCDVVSEVTNKENKINDDTSFEDLVAYEFNFPRKLCGKLIGKNGVHVDNIRSRTQTQIGVRNDPNSDELQIVCVSGRLKDVDRALDMISLRFPAKQFPQISFKPISKPIVYRRYNPEKNSMFNDSKILVAPNMFVDFASVLTNMNETADDENKNEPNKSSTNDLVNVYVTAVVDTSHLFVQLPTHPTFNSLQKLDESMSSLYNSLVGDNVPLMLEPIEYGTICVAPTSYGWHRAMVTNYQSREEVLNETKDYNEFCGLATIKFLDYGGYLTLPSNQLRQLRSDFMNLPFQAVECYLDGCYPKEKLENDGKFILTNLTKDGSLKATVTGFTEDGIPLIKLYLTNHFYENLDITQRLIEIGLAYTPAEIQALNELKFEKTQAENELQELQDTNTKA